MRIWPENKLPSIPKLRMAVVGHIEWITFLKVDSLPEPGKISHATKYFEGPAGGGAVSAIKMASILKQEVTFFTSLGNDDKGKESKRILEGMGLKLQISWRNQETRSGISLIDEKGDRAITVIGKRLEPRGREQLQWEKLIKCDGIFISAGDKDALSHARQSKVLTVTPRVGIKTLQESNIRIDALIGSGLDPGERVNRNILKPKPKLIIATEGEKGGIAWPFGRYKAASINSPLLDTYGCGDSFAAGVTIGLAAGWTAEQAISLGAHSGALCSTYLGPYNINN